MIFTILYSVGALLIVLGLLINAARMSGWSAVIATILGAFYAFLMVYGAVHL